MSSRKSSRGGIGLSTIIFWLLIWFFVFHDNDKEDKTEVNIVEQAPQVEEPVQKDKPKIDLKGLRKEFGEALSKAKDEAIKIKEELTTNDAEEENGESEPVVVSQPKIEEKGKEIKQEAEQQKPSNNNNETELKKL